ncbi:hypothetical protein [Streptomyces sp. NPDC046385]|uniref:effector-associated constant component EACC1 n=1 Tax=Streptomyces sp. NPDC046385 TaxID=3154918 RepID=UPI0033CB50C8
MGVGGGLVEVRVVVAGSERELTSLHRWIAQDREVVRDARVSLVTAPLRDGDMGTDFESISAVVDSALAFGSLVIAVLAWRDSRPAAPSVRIERDGATVELTGDAADSENVRRILGALGAPSGAADEAWAAGPAGERPAGSPTPLEDIPAQQL